jgi:hypothetical protein
MSATAKLAGQLAAAHRATCAECQAMSEMHVEVGSLYHTESWRVTMEPDVIPAEQLAIKEES